MTENSKIAWTDHTFNPWWGCVRVSEGCVHCYAETFSKRTGNDIWGADKPRRFFGQKHWAEPLKWDRDASVAGQRRRVFCASMADVFETHKTDNDLLNSARERLSVLVKGTPNLDWLFLTKRIETAGLYLRQMFGEEVPDNLWLGCTAENQEQYDRRVPILATIDAPVKWVSIEPQIGPVSLFSNPSTVAILDQIDWVIVGGESGAGCRPFNMEWARTLRDECAEAEVAFFMKQLGGHPKKRDSLADFPADLQVREWPRLP